MKLSNLVYLVVKNVKYLEDYGFTYEAFLNKDFDGDPDYRNTINNAISPINEAIHRLSDRNKIAYKVIATNDKHDNGILYLDDMAEAPQIKKIKSVFSFTTDGHYQTYPYREISRLRIFLGSLAPKSGLHIQYIEDIPPFTLAEIYDTTTDVELLDYGISETMCDYIIEYAIGRLNEPIAPELANLHLTRAEQYFGDLEEQQTYFSSGIVKRKYGIQ